jgi:16S rRNA (guanine(527)-N(7))-methyltransferase RsmG
MDAPRADYFPHVAELLPEASPTQQEQLAKYLHMVSQYSSVLNLTSFNNDPATLAGELVGEALRLLELGGIPACTKVVDLGSGAGCPVVTLAMLCPAAHFTAVESRARRAAFLRTVQARLPLPNLDVREMRAEALAEEHPQAFDLLTSRAFAPPERLLPLALKLVHPGAEIRGYLGTEIDALTEEASSLGLTVVNLVQYRNDPTPRYAYRLQA